MLEARIPFIAFPLRLKGPYLARCDSAQAAVALIGIMARTPRGSWKEDPEFGFRDDFDTLRTRRRLPPESISRLNSALASLGVDSFQVESIEREPGVEPHVLVSLIPAQGGQPVAVEMNF